jgi:hypothetical protein
MVETTLLGSPRLFRLCDPFVPQTKRNRLIAWAAAETEVFGGIDLDRERTA